MSYVLGIGELDFTILSSNTSQRNHLIRLLGSNFVNFSSFSRILELDQLQEVPVSIFNSNLSPLESLVVYLRSTFTLRMIGSILNRSEKTIGTTHRNALIKLNDLGSNKLDTTSKELIPLNVFSDRRLSVLEQVSLYLVQKGFKYSQVGSNLNKDRRVIWTVCKRARIKLKEEEYEYSQKSILLSKKDEDFLLLVKNFQKEFSFSNKTVISLLVNNSDDMIPLSIFSDNLSPLESLVFYLKEKGYGFRSIGNILNRSEKTISTTYHNTLHKKELENSNKKFNSNTLKEDKFLKKNFKRKKVISYEEYLHWIPLQLFSDRRLSILEHVCTYLSTVGIKLSRIGTLLNKDRRVIWTTKNRAKQKLKSDFIEYTKEIENFKINSSDFYHNHTSFLSIHKSGEGSDISNKIKSLNR